MNSNKGVNIKIYFTHPDGSEEVRRFFLPGNPPSDFGLLKGKVRTLFELEFQDFKIQWKDSEEDFVVISSDDELLEAVTECLNDEGETFLRLYVSRPTNKKPDGEKESKAEDNSKVHLGVECDGCEGPVMGTRFKCINCFDYDLCETCEVKGVHKHHEFQRIPHSSTAGDSEASPNATGNSGPPPCGGRKGHGGHRGHGRHGRRHWGPGGQCPFNAGPHGNRQAPPFQWNFSSAGDGIPFVAMGTGVSGTPSGMGGMFRGSSSAPCGMGGTPCAMGGMFPGPGNGFPDVQKVAEEASKFASEMATKHVADVMKGIWTAWSGHPSCNTESPGGGSSSVGSESAAGNIPVPGINIGITVDENGVKKSYSFGSNEQHKGGEKGSQTTPTETEKEDRSKRESASPEMVFMDVDDTLKPSQPATQTTQASAAVTGDDWTLLNQDGSPTDNTGRGNDVNYPILDDLASAPSQPSSGTPTEAPHTNERVRKALAQMQSMGYSDEGGWLTRLLEMKDGDLNQVLDLLLVPKK